MVLEAKNFSLTNLDMVLYPNPASSTVTIIAPDDGIYDLVLFNIIGQAVYRKNKGVHSDLVLDLHHYEDGVYFVYLINENNTYSKRLILKK